MLFPQKKTFEKVKGAGLMGGYSRRNLEEVATMTWELGGRRDGRPQGGGFMGTTIHAFGTFAWACGCMSATH